MNHRFLLSLLSTLALALPSLAAETAAITESTPWRVFLVCSVQEKVDRKQWKYSYTTAPPTNWNQADFNDSGWGRYSSDLPKAIGGYGYEQSSLVAMLCLRTHFGITEPAKARDLTLALEYRGGVVVYVNGQEIARQHMPQGPIEVGAPSEAAPPEAFTDASGAELEGSGRPATKNLERYEQRIRKLTVTIPPKVMRRGGNVLALQVHSPANVRHLSTGRSEWSGAGVCSVKLVSATGEGVSSYADAAQGITFWNATPMDTVAANPKPYQSGFLWFTPVVTPIGLTRGNPFEPLQPIRTAAPRGGTCSGQIVVTGATKVQATLTALKQDKGGATLPAAAVQIRYAVQNAGDAICNALQPKPADGAAVQPVWVLVDVPRDQAPGWYTGTLTVTADAKSAQVPVQVLVSGWTLPLPGDNATFVSIYQSPDTLADYFKVEPWSDAHFGWIEKSMRSMPMLGNDVLIVPVAINNYLNHKTGMIRWVKKGNGYEPDFTAFERYLDLQTKVWGKPKVVTLYVWKHDFGTRTWFRGMKSDVVKPCMVTEYDPATKAMKPMQAPHFGEPGSEEFWKKMTDGVRGIMKAKGLDERFLLLGEAFDSRPLEQHRLFWAKIEPTMRWHIYSHFDGGEPAVKDGKFICHGGFDVGLRIYPNSGGLPVWGGNRGRGGNTQTNDFITIGVGRVMVHPTSSPLSYRRLMHIGGTLARTGLDFWPIGVNSRGNPASYYGCPPNEGWLWRGHVPSLTAPSPEGAMRTAQSQMLLEGLQEMEVKVALQTALAKVTSEQQKLINDVLGRWGSVSYTADRLSQPAISLDLLGIAANAFDVAAESTGLKNNGDWANPPAVTGGGR